jgi:hypothetical protein
VNRSYGSTTEEGISYTEKEYDYAVENDLKVIALLHEHPEEIPVGKSDIAPDLQEKLNAFREKVASNRLVKFWNEAKELPGLVALSLSKTIKTFPATGWVRASATSSEELLSEINELRKENALLRAQLLKASQPVAYSVEGVAGLDESFTIHGKNSSSHGAESWSISLKWREIYAIISPYLVQHPNRDYVKAILTTAIAKRKNPAGYSHTTDDQDFQTIAIQLKALGLIRTEYSQTVKGGMALFWYFTPEGEKLMVQLRAIRSKNNDT